MARGKPTGGQPMNESTLAFAQPDLAGRESADPLEEAWAYSNGKDHSATPTERLRLIIADPDPLARRVIRDSLRASQQFVVAAEAKDGTEVVELAAHYKPELVLMEIRLPCVDGIEACRRIVAKAPQV